MKLNKLTRVALVAATYTALNLILLFPVGTVQFRVAEGLCVLPCLFPETVWGLTLGCFLSNLFVGQGIVDVIFGTLATLLAGLLTTKIKNKWLSPLPAVFCNGLIVAGVLCFVTNSFTAFPVFFLQIAVGEAVSCYLFGIPLLTVLKKDKD